MNNDTVIPDTVSTFGFMKRLSDRSSFLRRLPVYITRIGREERHSPTYIWDNQRHNRQTGYLLQYTVGGQGTIEWDLGGIRQKRILSPGDLFAVSPLSYQYRYSINGKGWSFFWLKMNGPLTTTFLQEMTSTTPVISGLQGSAAVNKIRSLHQTLISGDTITDGDNGRLAYSILLHLYEAAARPGTGGADTPWLEDVRRIVHQQLPDVTPNTVAAAIGIHPKHLYRLFRRRGGITPNTFITRERIRLARLLLTETDKTIDRIAVDIGYASRFYFSRVFKENTGLPPARYRDRYRAGIPVKELV